MSKKRKKRKRQRAPALDTVEPAAPPERGEPIRPAPRVEKAAPARPGRSPAPALSRVDDWLQRHRAVTIVVIVLASMLLRAGYFLEVANTPIIDLHHWDQSDMNTYDYWAREIAGGDWLTDQSLHPKHGWHKDIADTYFRVYPDERAALEQRLETTAGEQEVYRAFWDEWYGGKVFHTQPLYPYVIGVIYKVFGPDVRWALTWQLVLGVLCNVLVYLIAREAFGDLVANVAVALAVLYGPLLFYEMVLIRATSIRFLVLLSTCLIMKALRHNTWPWWLGAGAAFGSGILLKVIFNVLTVASMAAVFWSFRKIPKAFARATLILCVGALICLMPAFARNIAVGVPAFKLASPQSAFGVNSKYYKPELNYRLAPETTVRIKKEYGEAGVLSGVIQGLKTHENVVSILRQMWGKVSVLWHWYEQPNNANFYYFRQHSTVLRLLPFTFSLLAPVCLVGLVLAAPRWRACLPLFATVAALVLIFFMARVNARHRVPFVAILLPFAGLTIVTCGKWIMARRWDLLCAGVGSMAVLSFWTMRPLPPEISLIRPADYMCLYDYYKGELGDEAARDYLQEALEIAPSNTKVLFNLGHHLQREGNLADALAYYRKALDVNPSYAQALNNLAVVNIELKQYQEAVNVLRVLLRQQPNNEGAYVNLLSVYILQQNYRDALPVANEALRRFPENQQLQQQADIILARAAPRNVP